MDLELEWYEGVRNGNNYLCDRCNERELNIDEFRYLRNQRGVYCENCANWIVLKKFKCNKCHSKGTLRSENILPKTCCGEEVTWLK